jgi:hypothetical protein
VRAGGGSAATKGAIYFGGQVEREFADVSAGRAEWRWAVNLFELRSQVNTLAKSMVDLQKRVERLEKLATVDANNAKIDAKNEVIAKMLDQSLLTSSPTIVEGVRP